MGDSSGDPPISPPDSGTDPDDGGDGSGQSGISDYTEDEKKSETGKTEPPEQPPGGGGGGGGSPAEIELPEEHEYQEDPDDEDDHEERDEHRTPETPDSDHDQDEPDDDREEDDDEEQIAWVTQHSDAWDAMGWGLHPVILQLKEEFRDQIRFDVQGVPIREFESPDEMADTWESNASRHGMPINASIWDSDPPASTELSNRAFAAAREQGSDAAKDYLRRLRRAAIVEERNIEDESVLMELADEAGLDTDTLSEEWDEIEVDESGRTVETPQTTIHLDGTTVSYEGYFHPNDVKMMFEQAGFEEYAPRPLPDFVAEYSPVATKEVMQVYGLEREEAIQNLREEETVSSITIGDTNFWIFVS